MVSGISFSLTPLRRGISLVGTAVGPEAPSETPTRPANSGRGASAPKPAKPLSPDPSQAVNREPLGSPCTRVAAGPYRTTTLEGEQAIRRATAGAPGGSIRC